LQLKTAKIHKLWLKTAKINHLRLKTTKNPSIVVKQKIHQLQLKPQLMYSVITVGNQMEKNTSIAVKTAKNLEGSSNMYLKVRETPHY